MFPEGLPDLLPFQIRISTDQLLFQTLEGNIFLQRRLPLHFCIQQKNINHEKNDDNFYLQLCTYYELQER
jgi:hypothetical protein